LGSEKSGLSLLELSFGIGSKLLGVFLLLLDLNFLYLNKLLLLISNLLLFLDVDRELLAYLLLL